MVNMPKSASAYVDRPRLHSKQRGKNYQTDSNDISYNISRNRYK